MSCVHCIDDLKTMGSFYSDVVPNNKGVYDVECPNGHKFKIDIMAHKFQLLFENGIQALVNKYYIESFMSFVTSYERFIEFVLRTISISNKVAADSFNETWKQLSKQSERQLGAFILLHLNEFNTTPKLLSQNNVQLRNNVVHKGHLPVQTDCYKYGNGVLGFIRENIRQLQSKDKFKSELIRSINDSGKFEKDEIYHHFIPYQLFPINRNEDVNDQKTVEQMCKDLDTFFKR